LSELTDIAQAQTNLGLSSVASLPPSGNGNKAATTTGTLTNGHLAAIDANGNFVDSGSAGSTYTLPAATAATLGGVIVPAGALSVDGSGNLSAVTGTTSGTLAAGNDARIAGAAQKSANLSDLASASAARTSLGLGTASTQASTAFVADPGANGIVKRTGAGTSAVAIGSDLPSGYPYASLSGSPTI